MSTARRAPKRSAVSESNYDGHDIIDLCSVSSGDEAVRVAAGSAAAVSYASVYSESEENDRDTEAEGIHAICYRKYWLICFFMPSRICRCSCARV